MAISLGSSLSADPNIIVYSKGNVAKTLAGIGVSGMDRQKMWLSAYKTCNISETGQNGAKVTINYLHKVTHGLSVGAETFDLE